MIQAQLFNLVFPEPKHEEITEVCKLENYMTPRAVERFLNVDGKTLMNYKFKKFGCLQLSKKKFYFSEKEILKFINENYHPALIVGETPPPALTLKDKLLSHTEALEFFKGMVSRSIIRKIRDERRIGYVNLSPHLYRYPKRDLINFINNCNKERQSYDD